VWQRRPAEVGFALVAVLWLVALLSLIAVAVLSMARNNSRLAENLLDRARLEAEVDAAVNLQILELLKGQIQASRLRGSTSRRNVSRDEIVVSLRDEAGKIDLNAAPEAVLAAVFANCGISVGQSAAFAKKIATWRTDPQQGGIEVHRFETVSDLRNVIDIDARQFAAVTPSLTVYSGLVTADERTAEAPVLLALPQMAPDKVNSILEHRKKMSSNDATTGPEEIVSLLARAISIRAVGQSSSGIRFARMVVVRPTGDPTTPYWVLSWRDGIE
jgi:general secretion pathway protein K